ncbi:MAG: N-acetyl-gamma-glutamyl-phosphate reductase [Planctomycetaceae bacterium]|nr:N-acetyl-gamma-glutamyl-phosphate reductase [Planctomycetaceae bacterium]
MTVRVGILGATGYAALELIKILLRHPSVQVTVLTSRQEGRPHLADVHPILSGRLDHHLENAESVDFQAECDCVFSCLPHAASAKMVKPLLEAGLRVVDLSADYRLTDVAVYEQWYDTQHPDPERVGPTVYGLPEWFREGIPTASLVANPGCYPTSAILALAPLLKAGLVEPTGIIVDSKSGVSGAGRTPSPVTHFVECHESVMAYNVGKHRHTPEIDQVLARVSEQAVQVVFTPHLIPMERGILTTAYGRATTDLDSAGLQAEFQRCYEDEPFVRVVDYPPATRFVKGTNYCDLAVHRVGDHVVVISCLDNLVKGAAGAAVQNMNLMFGEDETTGLVERSE